VASVLVLALRPDLNRAVLHLLVRFQEVEPTARHGAIGDFDASPRLRSEPGYLEPLAIVDVVEVRGAGADLAHRRYLEAERVQNQAIGVGRDPLHVQRRRAAHRLGREVECQVQRQVQDAEGA
jgi:hypothetical protein